MEHTSATSAPAPGPRLGRLRRALVERLYECASIRRWNDQVRPVEFTELDKQAHKMIIAYALAKFEEGEGHETINWIDLIEGGIFELLHRIVLTDIKPPVFHKMMRRKGAELNAWVLEQLADDLSDVKGDFAEKFRRYLFEDAYAAGEKRLLKAAHFLATEWEFKIIYKVCPFVYGVERTKEEIESQIEDHYDLIGVQKLALGRKTAGFVNLCGQLRFQRRWSQSPRVPETSVLGHMLIVAIMTYLCLRELGACDRRIYNGFFAALFHDLPEVLTRDITSPVKTAIPGLDGIIKEYEKLQIDERLLPLLPHAWHAEMQYFMEDEFANKILRDGRAETVSFEALNETYNSAEFQPVDGALIKGCDNLAAFIEAALSIEHGITSKHLVEGKRRLLSQFGNLVKSGIDFGEMYRQFAGEQ